ncbi:SNARE associated Golgi protein [Penicillium italicum]|uniref:Golgi apparatus membrane protein TVP38 n=1 Tax=Penicillium italicum TaxID=40296 RepID=A0A0A2K8Q3_PENIT|nr:SNARE associated Golgi protein [Penicillium italicum]
MPADYQSTARALSLSSSSPDPIPSSPGSDVHPLWSRAGRQSSGRSSGQDTSYREQIIRRGTELYVRMNTIWEEMTLLKKIGTVFAALFLGVSGLAFLVLTGKLFIWLGPVAEKWETSWLAALILWLCVFFVSFPPLVGWSTFGTVAGFIFGIWEGWLIYASATILGSTVSFYVSRTILSGFVKRLMEHDKRFAALALTLKYDGLKLLCMIRLCPLPYSICNGAVSTFPTVQPLKYGLATAIVSPKLLVPAFIGSRIRLLSEKGEQMSAGSKAVNICSIILTVSIGIFTGWYIYQRFEPPNSSVVNVLYPLADHFSLFFRTLARAEELEAQERADIRDSLQADHAAHRPHRGFSEDPDVNKASTTLARDEEERIGFTDVDDDNVDLILGDDSDSEQPGPWKNSARRSYHDEFTDNDSDGFAGEDESYGLHTHVQK